MTNQQMLEFDVRVLIAKYGRDAVLACLGSIANATVEEIVQEISATRLKRSPQGSRSRSRQSASEVAARLLVPGDPRTRDLQELAARFDAKRLFPTMREVEAFLNKSGATSRPRSRAEAGGAIVKALATLSATALAELVRERTGGSDYFDLATEILGRKTK